MNKTLLYITGGMLFIVLYGSTHITLNWSPSMPVGLYRLTNEDIHRGTLVLLKEPLKEIAAGPGDTVQWAADGVRVNGRLLKDSAVPTDSPYPPFPYTTLKLTDQQYLTMGRHPLSFDGRYSGPTPQSLIAATLQPLWVSREIVTYPDGPHLIRHVTGPDREHCIADDTASALSCGPSPIKESHK